MGGALSGYEEMRFEDRIEQITLQEGWHELGRGWFCKVSCNGVCVEAFGTTKRASLRYARRAWRKAFEAIVQQQFGYPRVKECE